MIILSPRHIEQINEHAINSYPDECCGLVSGIINAAGIAQCHSIAPSRNLSTRNTRDSFEVDPQIRFNLMRDNEGKSIDGYPLELIGHYHSHPDNQASPSPRDLQMAYEPQLIWLIVSVMQGKINQITAHKLNAPGQLPGFHQIELKIQDSQNRAWN